MTPREIARKAITVLKEKGWTQGKYTDPETGAVCMGKAIYDAAPDPVHLDARNTLTKRLSKRVGVQYQIWNDRISTTEKDVYKLLKSIT